MIELLEDAKPYHTKPFLIPIIHKPTLKKGIIHELTLMKDVNRLIRIWVLKNINNFPSAVPTFIIPKINGTVRFISDFKELNERIKSKPFPIPKYSRFVT